MIVEIIISELNYNYENDINEKTPILFYDYKNYI